jgi:hypothetical protein
MAVLQKPTAHPKFDPDGPLIFLNFLEISHWNGYFAAE